MRSAEVKRHTRETQIRAKINLDGQGHAQFTTGVPFLDHMLDQIARHGMIDLEIRRAAIYISTPITPSKISALHWAKPLRKRLAINLVCVVMATRTCPWTKRYRALSWIYRDVQD